VAQDLAHYLAQSEQTNSAVALGVFLGSGGEIEAAAGFFVHTLPGASEDEIDQVEANVRGFPGPGELVREGFGADGILHRLLAGLGAGEVVRNRPLFRCGCGRERVLRTIELLGRDELALAASSGETLEIRCEFCGEEYRVGGAEIEALLHDA
jgi:molecular chaperone Hsp33